MTTFKALLLVALAATTFLIASANATTTAMEAELKRRKHAKVNHHRNLVRSSLEYILAS
jgi:hypothetical protein